MVTAKKEEEIKAPQQILFNFREKDSKIDLDLFKLIYDAQLKKMLAYIGLGVSSFIPQITIFFFIVGKVDRVPSDATFPIILLAFGLWLAQIFFVVAIITKFHELMIMENKLNITLVHREVFYRIRPPVAKLWDLLFRRALIDKGTEGDVAEERYRKTNRIITGTTLVVVLFVTVIFAYILTTLVSS